MKEFLKKYFIPHEGNDHKPHFLRAQIASYVFMAILVGEVFFLSNLFALDPSRPYLAAIFPSVLVDLANDNRAQDHLGALQINPVLERAARDKAEDMAAKGYFAHTTPEGYSPWYWFYKNNYSFAHAGENLAVNFLDSKEAVDAWMASPKHRENILNGNFTETGIGIAEGTYKGEKATFIVQLFGHPAPKVASLSFAITPTAVAQVFAPPSAETPAPPVPVAVAIESQRQESYMEVHLPVDAENVEVAVATNDLAEANINTVPQTSLTERLVSMPKTTVNYLLIALMALVGIALALKVFVKFHIQHPALIIRGGLLLLTLGYLIFVNEALVRAAASVF